jgi:hypothetical protein
VHLGTGSVSSKTEAMLFPSQNSDPLDLTETADFEVFPGRFISYCDKFTYLGSLLTPDLCNKAKITRRIGLAHGQMKLNELILHKSMIIPKAITLCTSTEDMSFYLNFSSHMYIYKKSTLTRLINAELSTQNNLSEGVLIETELSIFF